MRYNRKARAGMDRTPHALRKLVERCFGSLENSRSMATRYDKTATSFYGFVNIACTRLWTRRFATRPRVALTIRVNRKLNSTDVIDMPTNLFILPGPPACVHSNHGPKFIAQAART